MELDQTFGEMYKFWNYSLKLLDLSFRDEKINQSIFYNVIYNVPLKIKLFAVSFIRLISPKTIFNMFLNMSNTHVSLLLFVTTLSLHLLYILHYCPSNYTFSTYPKYYSKNKFSHKRLFPRITNSSIFLSFISNENITIALFIYTNNQLFYISQQLFIFKLIVSLKINSKL